MGPTSYLVLGLIGLRGPSTPYDLKRAAARSVAYFWSFPHSQLYSEPDRLAEAGLLEIERERGGRNRKVYDLTEAGHRALRAWLAAPPEEMPELRDTALLQLFFGELTSRAALVALAEQQGRLHRERLAIYEEIASHYAGRSDRRRRMAPLGIGFALEKAHIEFWKTIAAEID
jgi:PadR family transcriptional regulator AphA